MIKSSHAQRPKSVLGMYLKEISAYALLSPEEEIQLGRLAQQGDEAAVQRLVEANLRFVVNIAKKYRGLRLSLMDLIHEGNLGLMRAARLFDPSRQVRFVTYAVWWIRQSIVYAISNYGHLFRVPVKTSTNLYRINHLLAKQAEVGAVPTVEQLTAMSGLTASEVEQAFRLRHEIVSLHQPAYSNGDRTLEEVIPDTTQSGLEEALLLHDRMQSVRKIMDQLTRRELRVFILRFGLSGGEPQTLVEIGRQMGVSRERIRQIQVRAIRRLRDCDESGTVAG